MLQQTRVVTVLDFYPRFLQRFPDLRALAAASLQEVLQLWSGLGYYARARQAHACARLLVHENDGHFPSSAQGLEYLPGVGASTAAAIAAFCFGERAAILDANVQRVLARQYAVTGDPKRAQVRKKLWEYARGLLPPADQIASYTQAMMDLGAQICTRTRPHCAHCPVSTGCQARQKAQVAQIPTRLPRVARPIRHAHMLVAMTGRAVFLEHRAASGIWGGLLSFPEFSGRKELLRAAQALGAARPQALATRKHGFTHFTLALTPYLLFLPQACERVGAKPGRWMQLRQAEKAAVPAPVRALLHDLRQEHQANRQSVGALRTRMPGAR